MADKTLASCLETLSAVFILGGDIMPAQNREHLGGLGWRSLEGLENDKRRWPSKQYRGQTPARHRVLEQIRRLGWGSSLAPLAAGGQLVGLCGKARRDEAGREGTLQHVG